MAMNNSYLQSELSPQEEVIISLWYWAALLLCWSGNAFVLHATIRHKAIQLDAMSVWLIQNLAVTDICHGLFHVLPTAITTAAGYRWVLGPPLCKALMIVRYVFIDFNSVLINVLVLNKLYRCWRPLTPSASKRCKIGTSCVAVMLSNVYTAVTLSGVISEQVAYTPYLFGCGVVPSINDHIPYAHLDVILTCVVTVVPSLTLITSNTTLIAFARYKGRSAIKKANLVIVGTITLVYMSANLPYLIWMLHYYQFIRSLSGITLVKYTRFTMLVLQVSCFVNPFIYYCTNRRFKLYTLAMIGRHYRGHERGYVRGCSTKTVSSIL